MSRHLDQPSITIGNQRTQFYQFQQDLVAHKQPAFSLPSTPQPPPSPRPSQFQQVCGVDPTRPCSDQALATCCVTSAKGLSLPLKVIKGKVNHLSFITSPYSPDLRLLPHIFIFLFHDPDPSSSASPWRDSLQSAVSCRVVKRNRYLIGGTFFSGCSLSLWSMIECLKSHLAVLDHLGWKRALNLIHQCNGLLPSLWSCSLKLTVWL